MTTAELLTFVLGGAGAYRRDDHAVPEPEPRRFRPPWSVEDRASCFVVKDRAGQELAYIYYENDPRRRSIVKLLSRDEARSIAAAVAKLPDMVS
jgi:hypothetical protein